MVEAVELVGDPPSWWEWWWVEGNGGWGTHFDSPRWRWRAQ